MSIAMLKDSYGRWTFPKGHLDEGETTRQAAIREIEEEIGLGSLRAVAKLGTIDIWFRDRFKFKGKLIHKYIHYFLFEAVGDTKLRKLENTDKDSEKIHAVAWIPVKTLRRKSSYQDLIPIVDRALMVLEGRGWV
ncbi:NUDIX domain-containing protein [Candidatus Uhrbacteria bacterium]|nr:NUDIX domain-containing protein [Candidatus Uhrbacteria bacterium]